MVAGMDHLRTMCAMLLTSYVLSGCGVIERQEHLEAQRLRNEQAARSMAEHAERLRVAKEEQRLADIHQQGANGVFETCIFMRSPHLSEPNTELLDMCMGSVPPVYQEAVRKLVIAQWPERQEEVVRRDKQATAYEESLRRAEEERWSGHAPITILDKYGNTDFELSRKVEKLLYPDD